MGFLQKLWDETFAGPTPDTGLGKLRKYDSFSSVRSPPPIIRPPDEISVTRSIIILPINSNFRNISGDGNSVPTSPAGSNAPTSPFSPTTPRPGRAYFKRFTRTKSSPEELESAEPRSQTDSDECFGYMRGREIFASWSFKKIRNKSGELTVDELLISFIHSSM